MFQSVVRNNYGKIGKYGNAIIGKSNKKCQSTLLTLRSSALITKMSESSLSLSANCLAQQKIEVMGVNINYEKVGNGPHPIICLPGAIGFIDSDFAPILKKFSLDKFTVVAWDPPGYGRSRPPDKDFSGGAQFFHRDAAYADGLMKNLGYPKYSVLGWSDGGITGLIQSSKFTSVHSLVVWGANAYVSEDDMKCYKEVGDIDKWSPKMKAPLIAMYGEDYFKKIWKRWLDTFEEIYNNGGDLCKNDLKNIKCPTLIIHGLKDPMVPQFHADYLNQHVKNSKLITLPEAKHNLHLRYPDEFVQMVEKFLGEQKWPPS